jgi:glycine/D-amino acid oxidase-like deaminating enzyme
MEEITRQANARPRLRRRVEPKSRRRDQGRYPHLNVSTCGRRPPALDGQCDPANIAMALAKRRADARRADRVKVTAVTEITQSGDRVTGVDWEGRAGPPSPASDRQLRRHVGPRGRPHGGVTLPLHACEHFYIVTEPIAGLGPPARAARPGRMRLLQGGRRQDDARRLRAGGKPWGMDGIPEELRFDQLPEDVDHFEPILERAVNRMPMLGRRPASTPSSTAPKASPPTTATHLGEAPGSQNGYWVAAGYNSIGIVSAGGAGMALAQWMDTARRPSTSGRSTSAAPSRSRRTAAT